MTILALTFSLVAAMALPPAAMEQQPTLDGTWRARLQDNWTRNDGGIPCADAARRVHVALRLKCATLRLMHRTKFSQIPPRIAFIPP